MELRNPGALFNISLFSGSGPVVTVRILSIDVAAGDRSFDVRASDNLSVSATGLNAVDVGVE